MSIFGLFSNLFALFYLFLKDMWISNAKALATSSALLIFLLIYLDDAHGMNNKVLMAQQQITGPSFPWDFSLSV